MYSVLVQSQRVMRDGIYEMQVAVDHAGDWSVYTEDASGLTVIGKVDAETLVALDADPDVLILSVSEIVEEQGGE